MFTSAAFAQGLFGGGGSGGDSMIMSSCFRSR